MRETEKRGGDEEGPARTNTAFEKVLYPAAEEDFFREGDREEGKESEGRDEARVGKVVMKREEVQRKAEGDGKRRVEEKFAEAGYDVVEAQMEVEADSGEPAQSENGVKRGVEQDELAEDGGSVRPCGLEQAKVDGEAQGKQDESVEPMAALSGVETRSEEFECGHGGWDEQIEQTPSRMEITGAKRGNEIRKREDGGEGEARDEGQTGEGVCDALVREAEC